ncbi:hypothetical protein ACWEFL_13490 [Streptomyces sp. NPDC004838]
MQTFEEDLPTSLTTCWNYWMAVPTGDQAGVMHALGLTAPTPVTFAVAREVIDADGHGDPDDAPAADGEPDEYSRVFVSPELDGWTLVVGAWCDPSDGERAEDVLGLCTALSTRYGKAQAYYYGAQGDGSAWLLAENGVVLRRYSETGEDEDEELTLGAPLVLERARRMELGLTPDWDAETESEEAEEEWAWAANDLAPEIAEAFGVSPLDLAADTPVRGTGLLALTPHGVARGVRRALAGTELGDPEAVARVP